jgi:nucleoside-triphosphatase THEP1
MSIINKDVDPSVLAAKFINHTNKNIFLTGKAGTGKTTFLKHISENTHKKTVIVAPTGIAAINAGGVTIHSLFQLPFGNFIPFNQHSIGFNEQFKVNTPLSVIKGLQMHESKRKLLREIELMIIDEVSMLRADLLDAVDTVLRHIRQKNDIPFGGVQVLFIGDLLQLPPVVKDNEWQVLKSFYPSIYFFDARVFNQEKPLYIELEKIYRQADDRFISLLNNLRNNRVNNEDISLLNKYHKPAFKPKEKDNYITLTTHNNKADTINKIRLQELKGESFYFNAFVEGDFNEFAYPVEKSLELKNGAQIMFIKNDPTGNQRFFNGKIGTVSKITDQSIEVLPDNSTKPIVVEKYEWKNIKYALNESTHEIDENVTGTFTQYPIKLAWAITVHKSQGLTFEKAILDIGDAFAPGQVYVALSRLKSLEGLVLTSQINFGIKQDLKLTEFSKTKSQQENLNTLITKESLAYLEQYLLESFDFDRLYKQLRIHADSYVKDEKMSSKQKHHAWAQNLKSNLETVMPHADSFIRQIRQITDRKESGYLDLLNQRVYAARNYFTPILKSISNDIFQQIEDVKPLPKIKAYCEELLELENLVYEQLRIMSKASLLADVIISNKEYSSSEIKSMMHDHHRAELLNKAFTPGVKRTKEKKEKKTKEPKLKGEKKADTKSETFKLFKEGRSIEQIAETREMAVSTIEGHLVQYVAKGKVNAKDLVTEEKLRQITSVIKEFNTFQVGTLKEILNEDCSYREIKVAVASYLAESSD